METILREEQGFFGEMIHSWDLSHKNKYVITGLQQGGSTVDTRVGIAVQVRLEAGDFGSDNVLLRHVNGKLQQHHNQSFWLIPDEYKEYLDEMFKDHLYDDADEMEYTLGADRSNPEKGFIVPSKITEGESTPMRDIKSKIIEKLNDIIQ